VLEADGLSKGFEEKLLIDNLSFRCHPAALLVLLVPMVPVRRRYFKMLIGGETPDEGAVCASAIRR
jgi:ABC-type lipopolysaccharide export system ATPase subunit